MSKPNKAHRCQRSRSSSSNDDKPSIDKSDSIGASDGWMGLSVCVCVCVCVMWRVCVIGGIVDRAALRAGRGVWHSGQGFHKTPSMPL